MNQLHFNYNMEILLAFALLSSNPMIEYNKKNLRVLVCIMTTLTLQMIYLCTFIQVLFLNAALLLGVEYFFYCTFWYLCAVLTVIFCNLQSIGARRSTHKHLNSRTFQRHTYLATFFPMGAGTRTHSISSCCSFHCYRR